MRNDNTYYIREDDVLEVRASQHDNCLSVSIKDNKGHEIHLFDWTNGKNLLKIADAIETAIQNQNLAEARAEAEREHFNKTCQLCLLPFTEGCVHSDIEVA